MYAFLKESTINISYGEMKCKSKENIYFGKQRKYWLNFLFIISSWYNNVKLEKFIHKGDM